MKLEKAVGGVPEETGAERMRRVVGVMGITREGALDGFLIPEIVRMFEAVWASKWDILPDDLTDAERRHAAKRGKLSEAAERRLARTYG